MTYYQVRMAKPDEVGLALNLDAELFPDWCESADRPGAVWWLARDPGGDVVAYAAAAIYTSGTESALLLTRAGVHRFHRGHGLQRRLIEARVRHAGRLALPCVWTYTHKDNHASSNNLIRSGFTLWTPAHWGGRLPGRDFLFWKRKL